MFYLSTEEVARDYHDRRLQELDHTYRLHKAQTQLIRKREEARATGIGPGDPDYPVFDLEKFLDG